MPATTTKALLPYPLGSDPFANADEVFRSLTDRLERLLTRSGIASCPTTAGSSTSTAVDFGYGFSTPPVVSVSLYNTTRPDLFAISVHNVTETGFSVSVYRSAGSGNVQVMWRVLP